MKNLFDENDKWTPEALDLSNEARKLLKPLFDDMVLKGYSIRQAAHILTGTILELECYILLKSK